MSVGADSLMAHIDMFKLLDKETLERGRVIRTKSSKNVQIGDLVRAIVTSEPCLFNNSPGNLMPVVETVYDHKK